MVRVVGKLDRSPYVLDPLEALRMGRRVDAQLSSASVPRVRGVVRARHEVLNEMDARRQLKAALRVAAGARDG